MAVGYFYQFPFFHRKVGPGGAAVGFGVVFRKQGGRKCTNSNEKKKFFHFIGFRVQNIGFLKITGLE